MGVISSALNSALENLGRATMDVGNSGLMAGYNVWEKCCNITVIYLKASPGSGSGNAWGIVTGSLFSISMGIAASLSILVSLLTCFYAPLSAPCFPWEAPLPPGPSFYRIPPFP